MRLIERIQHPSDRQLRQFTSTLAAVIAAAAAWWGAWIWPLIVGAVVIAGAGWFWPRVFQPVFLGVSLVTFPIGLVVSELLLLAVFYLLFTPLGLLMRLAGRDPLQRRLDRRASSYWTPKARPRGVASYYRQS